MSAPRNRRRTIRSRLETLESRLSPATFSVLNVNDSGVGSLRQAILDANAAAGPDDIDFNPAFFNAVNLRIINLLAASGQLTIADDLIVNGPGAAIVTVNGLGAVRPFNVEAAGAVIDVTLAGLTVTGGNGSTGGPAPITDNGGGIRTADERLTLDGVVVTGNFAAGSTVCGGGIRVGTLGTLTIRNSTISGNTALRGGGVYFAADGSLLLEDSTISGNAASDTGGRGGGGMYFYGDVTADGFTIRNSTIVGNTALGSGGGLCLRNFNGTALIQNSTITDNGAATASTTAGHGGGGIALSSGSASSVLSIESTIVSGNSATSTNGRADIAAIAAASVFINFSAVGDGDGFIVTAPSGNNLPIGAALALLPFNDYGGPTQTVPLGPGSLAVEAGSNPAALTADQRGNGFPREVGTAADIGAVEGIFDAPLVEGGAYAPVTAAGGTTYTFDVGYSGSTPIAVATLDNNDIRVTGPNGFNQLATFVSVTPPGDGSPRAATYRITAPGGTFGNEDNGLYAFTVESDQVANVNGGTAVPGTVGTFRVAVGPTFTVTNLNDSGDGSLRQAILDANAAAGADAIVFQSGLTGTIILSAALGQLTISDSVTITGPGASLLTVHGNGVVRPFNVDNFADIIDVTLSGLTVTGGNGNGGGATPVFNDGGGIRITNERLTLDGVALTNNSTASTNDGGGIGANAEAVLTIRNSTISGNTARNGGGVYFYLGGRLLLENSTVSGNTATNFPSGGGGGLYFSGTVSAGGFIIRNSTIAGNLTSGSGGGLLLRSIVGTVRIQNSTITGNTSTSTIMADGYGGGGIAVNGTVATAVLTLESTIVSGNMAINSRNITAAPAATVNVNFCAIGVNVGFTPSAASGNNLPFGTPLGLGALANNGGPTRTIAFDSTSPLRDAGSNPAALTTDQRGPGFARSAGPGTDIGAFELQVAAPPPQVSGTVVNAGQANITQRSRVTSIAVTFDTQVTFAGAVANAFTLIRTGGGAVSFAATANVGGGVTVVTLSGFSGAETESGSLRDGRYTLTVLANQVSAGGQQMAANFAFGDAQGLFRFYGDINGDRRVDISDFGFFSLAYLTPANYNTALDFNNDGRIDIADFGQFSVRFFTTLP